MRAAARSTHERGGTGHRTMVETRVDDWEEMLCATEFVINNQDKCSLLGKTPIQIELHITPIIPSDLITDITTAKAVKKNTRGSVCIRLIVPFLQGSTQS